MLIHTGLFSNVSGLGLGLIHCGLGLDLKKIFGPRSASSSLFLASALASCPAGLVNITAWYMWEKKFTSFCQVLKKMLTKENWFLFSASRCIFIRRSYLQLHPGQFGCLSGVWSVGSTVADHHTRLVTNLDENTPVAPDAESKLRQFSRHVITGVQNDTGEHGPYSRVLCPHYLCLRPVNTGAES